MPKYKVTREDGTEVMMGGTITDFRGEEYIFKMVTRGVEYNGTAKICVSLPGENDPFRQREYNHQVFNLTVETLY